MQHDYEAIDKKTGDKVRVGDQVVDFRGATGVYEGISRLSRVDNPGSHKVLIRRPGGRTRHQYNASVFGLEIHPKED